MGTKELILADTMTSPETGDVLTRGIRPFDVTYRGETITGDQPGY